MEQCENQHDAYPTLGKSFPSPVTWSLAQNPPANLLLLLDETWGRQEHPCQEGWRGLGSPTQYPSIRVTMPQPWAMLGAVGAPGSAGILATRGRSRRSVAAGTKHRAPALCEGSQIWTQAMISHSEML